MTVPHHYFVELDIAGYRATVRVNGYGVLTPWRGVVRTVMPINTWIVDGDNTLEVELIEAAEMNEVTEPPAPEEDEDPPPKRWVFAGVGVEQDVPIGAMPGESAPRMLADLYGRDEGLARYELPLELATTFTVSSPFPRWRWQDGEQVDVADTEVRAELVSYLQRLHGLAGAGDIDAIMQQLSAVVGETAQAYGQPLSQLQAELSQLYRDCLGAPGFRLARLDTAALSPRSHCGGRVIELVAEDGAALIREDKPNGGWLLPLFVARLNGAWSIVSV